MGDHHGDGWNEWHLDAHFARQRAEEEAVGNFGAASEMQSAIDWVERAETTEHLRWAQRHYANAGVLAVKEALFDGIKIKGWKGEKDYSELPAFERNEDGKTRWFMNHHLSKLDELPDEFQIVASLADNEWLKDIRQTGSRLVPAGREARFAKARIESLRQELEAEESELSALQQ